MQETFLFILWWMVVRHNRINNERSRRAEILRLSDWKKSFARSLCYFLDFSFTPPSLIDSLRQWSESFHYARNIAEESILETAFIVLSAHNKYQSKLFSQTNPIQWIKKKRNRLKWSDVICKATRRCLNRSRRFKVERKSKPRVFNWFPKKEEKEEWFHPSPSPSTRTLSCSTKHI